MDRVMPTETDPQQTAQQNTEGEKRISLWEALIRKCSEDQAEKERCKSVSLVIPRYQRSTKTFPSGSTYDGSWDFLGMSGYGTYTFPHGVVYTGEFNDGMFHGIGELKYPNGAMLRGKWIKGVLTEKTLKFSDNLEYKEENWNYCRMPDRRFTVGIKEGLRPAGESFLTAEQPSRDIPSGYYDTEDGFFDPKTEAVYTPDLKTILRSPSTEEQKWIKENCRYNPQGPVGARKDLFEKWHIPRPKSIVPSLVEVSKDLSKAFMQRKIVFPLVDEDSASINKILKQLEDVNSESLTTDSESEQSSF